MICKTTIKITLIALLGIFALQTAHATTIISYVATDLADITEGEDLWQYTYNVDSDVIYFHEAWAYMFDKGIRIHFDYNLYGAIDPNPVAPNADWDISTWDPDPTLGNDGAFNANTQAGNMLPETFSVSFVWLGGEDFMPGSQQFEVYIDDMDYSIVETGNTVSAAPVPEPATMLLLGTGLVGLAGFGRKFRK